MSKTFDYSFTLFAPRKRVTHDTLSAVFKARGKFVVVDEGAGNFLIECEMIEDMSALRHGDFHRLLPFHET